MELYSNQKTKKTRKSIQKKLNPKETNNKENSQIQTFNIKNSFGTELNSNNSTADKNISKYLIEKKINNITSSLQKNQMPCLRHNNSCEDGIFSKAKNKSQNKRRIDVTSNFKLNSNNFMTRKNSAKNYLSDPKSVTSGSTSLLDKKNFNTSRSPCNTNRKVFSSTLISCHHQPNHSSVNMREEKKSTNPLTELVSNGKTLGGHSSNNSTIGYSSANIISKLDEKFRNIEEAIVDKKFEKAIDNDEIILNQKKTFSKTNASQDHNNDDSSIDDDTMHNFENAKDDFDLLYSKDYIHNIENDLLKLELQYEIGKILELQETYHIQFNKLKQKYNKLKRNVNLTIENFMSLDKQKDKLRHLLNKIEYCPNLAFNIQKESIQKNKEIVDINKTEFTIWKSFFKEKPKSSDTKKEKLNELKIVILKKMFDKIVVNNLTNLNLLDLKEQAICEKLVKKFLWEKKERERKEKEKEKEKLENKNTNLKDLKSFRNNNSTNLYNSLSINKNNNSGNPNTNSCAFLSGNYKNFSSGKTQRDRSYKIYNTKVKK